MDAFPARLVALACLVTVAPGVFGAQEDASRPAEQQESELDKLMRVAKSGRPAFRPQAARRLVDMGAPAAERLFAEAGETNRDLAALGTALVEVLGEFGDTRLRARLWEAIDDPDFPWRPAAARSLAVAPPPEERERILALLADPIAPVRHAAIGSLERIPLANALDQGHRLDVLLEVLMSDPDDRVRRAAAFAMDELGTSWGLFFVVEDLERTDVFFDRPDGKIARYEAARLLEDRFGESFGYDPEKAPDEERNAAAVARMLTLLDVENDNLFPRADRPGELPEIARASTHTIDAVLGLELRSCRKGEIFLRWSADDALWVGTGNAVRVDLPVGTVRGLLEAAGESLEELEGRRFWGEAGCDMEQVHVRSEAGAPVTTLVIAKGPDPAPDLRPEPLDALLERMVATLPEGVSEDPRLDELRASTLETLAVLGGPLD